ncbi:MAG: NUDIX hydrolase [Thermodesulfovibrionales bacterium]|nr:NUDIX hydrolase [Thermodesulfovibrionales bacterium]
MNIISKDTLWQGNFLRVVSVRYKDRSGENRKWEAVERVNCGGISAVIPITIYNEFILVRQFRSIVGKYVIEFPAGLVSVGEDPLQTAYRELIEETRCYSDTIFFLADGPVSSGLSSEILSIFIALDVKEAGSDLLKQYLPDESEDIEIIKTPVETIYETLSNYKTKGDLIDLKIYGMIELARQNSPKNYSKGAT